MNIKQIYCVKIIKKSECLKYIDDILCETMEVADEAIRLHKERHGNDFHYTIESAILWY